MKLAGRLFAFTFFFLFSLSTGIAFAANLSPIYLLLFSETFGAPSNLYLSACYTTGNPPRLIADCWKLSWTDNSDNESGFRFEKKCWMDGDPEPEAFELWKTLPADTTQTQYLYGSWQSGDQTCPAVGPAVWKFRVNTFNQDTSSSYAGPVLAYRCPELNPVGVAPPLNLTVVSSSSIRLNWTDYLDVETGWRILRQEVDASDNVVSISQEFLAANQTEFTDTFLKPSTKYVYHVSPKYVSTNMECEGFPPQWGSATTQGTLSEPNPPTSLTVSCVSKSSTSLSLAWTDNSDNEDGFFIFRSLDNLHWDQPQTVGANSNSYTDTGPNTGLTPCTPYYYKVAAYNSAGSSNEAKGNKTTPPAAPIGLIATTGPGVFGVHLDWADTSCAAKYNVYYLTSYSDPYQKASGPDILQSTVNVLDVDPDIYHFYRVSAVDANGNEGAWSCSTAPSAPSAGATSSSDTCKAAVGWAKSPVPVNLWGSWNNFTDKVYIGWGSAPLTWNTNGDPTSYAPQYDVFISIDNATWYDVPPGNPFSHPHNPPDSTPMMLTVPVSYANTVYYFKVQTRFEKDGEQWSSNPAFITTRTAAVGTPPEQTNILPAPGVSASLYYPNKIMVGWGAITGATGYEVHRSLPNNSGSISFYKTIPSTVTRFDDTDIQPYADYWYKVRAMNGTVEGQLSESAHGNASAF